MTPAQDRASDGTYVMTSSRLANERFLLIAIRFLKDFYIYLHYTLLFAGTDTMQRMQWYKACDNVSAKYAHVPKSVL